MLFTRNNLLKKFESIGLIGGGIRSMIVLAVMLQVLTPVDGGCFLLLHVMRFRGCPVCFLLSKHNFVATASASLSPYLRR